MPISVHDNLLSQDQSRKLYICFILLAMAEFLSILQKHCMSICYALTDMRGQNKSVAFYQNCLFCPSTVEGTK